MTSMLRLITRFTQTADVDSSMIQFGSIQLDCGDEIAVAIDNENSSYLRERLERQRLSKVAEIVWFETADGCLVGLNFAHVSALRWHPIGSDAHLATAWDRDNPIVHFTNMPPIVLSRIGGDAISRLQGATISCHRRASFYTLAGPTGESVSINLANMTYITMPSVWLDDDS